MKKIYLILSVFAVVFTSCDTDFDVNADWEEVTVVYGLLDAGIGEETQQIKISKAFLGKMDALQMAQYADSINFDKDELAVKLIRVKNNGITDNSKVARIVFIFFFNSKCGKFINYAFIISYKRITLQT